MSNKDTEIRSRYEDYSVEELQKAFKSTFLSSIEFSDADIEELDQIVAVLKRKHPVPRTFTTEESWTDFLKNHSEDFARIGIQNTEEVMKEDLETVAARLSSCSVAEDTSVGTAQEVTVSVKRDESASCDEKRARKHRRNWKHTALVAAAAVALMVLITVTAAAVGIDIWSWVPVWNDSTFKFVPEDSAPVTSLDIPAALKQLGIEEPLFPTWLPEGFELAEQQIQMDEPVLIHSSYYCGERALMITIRPISQSSQSATIEKDGDSFEIYKTHDTDHYVFTNLGQTVSLWQSISYYVKISGDISVEEMISIIDSVYSNEEKNET